MSAPFFSPPENPVISSRSKWFSSCLDTCSDYFLYYSLALTLWCLGHGAVPSTVWSQTDLGSNATFSPTDLLGDLVASCSFSRKELSYLSLGPSVLGNHGPTTTVFLSSDLGFYTHTHTHTHSSPPSSLYLVFSLFGCSGWARPHPPHPHLKQVPTFLLHHCVCFL